jgi:hypothetical protein
VLQKLAPGLLSSLTGTSSSYNRTGNKNYGTGSRFGTDIKSSRHGGKRSDRLELESSTELDDIGDVFRKDLPSKSKLTNTFWRGDGPPTRDSGSEKGVLGGMDATGNIRKTISVTVSEQKPDIIDDGQRSSRSSVKKFEHV